MPKSPPAGSYHCLATQNQCQSFNSVLCVCGWVFTRWSRKKLTSCKVKFKDFGPLLNWKLFLHIHLGVRWHLWLHTMTNLKMKIKYQFLWNIQAFKKCQLFFGPPCIGTKHPAPIGSAHCLVTQHQCQSFNTDLCACGWVFRYQAARPHWQHPLLDDSASVPVWWVRKGCSAASCLKRCWWRSWLNVCR